MTSLTLWLTAMRAELAEDLGQSPVASGRPRCPKCGYGLECFYQKQQKCFAVIHSVRDCENRWTEFGRGVTEKEAWGSVNP